MIILFIPFLITGTLKLIKYPNLLPVGQTAEFSTLDLNFPELLIHK
jgi:hypothetical protein